MILTCGLPRVAPVMTSAKASRSTSAVATQAPTVKPVPVAENEAGRVGGGVGGFDGPVEEAQAVEDLDVGVAFGGAGDQVGDAVMGDVADRHGHAAGVVGVGGERGHHRAVGPADAHPPRGAADGEEVGGGGTNLDGPDVGGAQPPGGEAALVDVAAGGDQGVDPGVNGGACRAR